MRICAAQECIGRVRMWICAEQKRIRTPAGPM
jgi:hypothetical protein